MSYDIVAMGELLIDFTPEAPRVYKANPGGGPPNMLAAASKFGLKTGFVGMVGEDTFGNMLKDDIENAGIDSQGVVFNPKAATTLAFVHLSDDGERSFSFIRNADGLLQEENVDLSIIEKSDLFHFSTVSMSAPVTRETTLKTLEKVKKMGKVISYDPNLRRNLWDNLDTAKEVMIKGLDYADIVKISEDELEFITGSSDWKEGAKWVLDKGANIVFVTLGPDGCMFAHKDIIGVLPTYNVKVVDTTGAGDIFMGSALSYIKNSGWDYKGDFTKEQLEEVVRFANASGAMSATKKGGITSVHSVEEIEDCIKNTPTK